MAYCRQCRSNHSQDETPVSLNDEGRFLIGEVHPYPEVGSIVLRGKEEPCRGYACGVRLLQTFATVFHLQTPTGYPASESEVGSTIEFYPGTARC